jgi:ABC-type amino acid transport substrate-binding protein
MFSKTTPEAKKANAKFNEGLSRIRNNGTYKAILAKYGLNE